MKVSYRNCGIQFIPSDAFENPEIEELDLVGNSMKELSKLKNLHKLRILNIWNNEITDLSPLKGLTNLEELKISNNDIVDISPLSELKKLKELRLSNNNIVDLSPLKKLKKLKKLSLCGNEIKYFPRFLLDLSIPILWKSWGKKEGIYIEDNPIQNIPIEILKQGNDTIIKYFNHLEEQEVIESHNVRLIVLGEAGVGKTTFCRKFLKRDSILEKEKTRGIDIAEYNFYSAKDAKINVTLWDFGGQEVYHQTHQLFLSPNAFYILIVDSRRNNNLYYWLELINLYSSNPILIIVNKGDVHHLRLNENEIISSFPNVLKFYYTSFKEDNFKLTRREIHTAIESLPNLSISLPRKWNDIKESLTKLSKQNPYLSIEEFDKLCENYNLVTWEVKESLLNYLNSCGEIIYYDDLLLNDIIFLDLSWVLDSIYKLLNNNDIILNQGQFNEKMLPLIWKGDNYHNIRNKLILILMKFEICYQTNQSTNDSKYIIPQLLPIDSPEYALKLENNKGIVFQYNFMPSNIFSRLLVIIQKIATKIIHIWRKGIIFQYKTEKVSIKQDTFLKKISINTDANQADILSIVKRELTKLNKTFQNIQVETLIPCICSICLKSHEPYFYNYKHLLAREKLRKTTIECINSLEDVSVNALLASILDKEYSKPKKIFISYSREDNKIVEKLIIGLNPFIKKGLIEVWYDGEITSGSNWGEAIKHQLSVADIILAIVSPDFLLSDYIWDIEMAKALIRHEEEKAIIIPIIARNCLWQKTPFGRLQALPTNARPINIWESINDAINDVIRGLNRVINAPVEIQEQGIKALRSYYEEIQDGKSAFIDEVKLILVGNGEVGKSTIANNLINPNYGVPQTLRKQTSGLDILKWLWQKKVGAEALNVNSRDLIKLNLNIWDFGGQGRYRIMQQLFCSRNSIYLFVTSKDDKEKNKADQYVDFEYWIPFINAYGYDIDTNKPSPIIHIRNKVDDRKEYINERKYINYPDINIIDYIKISCYRSEDIERLIDLIIYNAIPVIGNKIGREYPTSWVKTKNELEEKEENYLNLTDYQKIARKNDVKEDNIKVLLKLLDSIGTILMPAIKNKRIYNRNLKDIIILNPDWLRKAIGLVLDSGNNGSFSKNNFDSIWQKYSEMEKDLFIDLMIAFELCYFSEKNNRYIVPVLLPNQYTITNNELPVFTYEFEFSYFIPAGFVHKLIIRLYQDNFEILEHWRDGAIIKYQKCKAKVTEHWHTQRITINLYGDNIDDIHLLKIVLNKKINDIIGSFIPRLRQEDLKVKEKIICNCRDRDEFCRFEIDTLKRKRDRGQVYIDCHQNQENQIPIITLMNYKIKREKKRVFLSYAQEDIIWLKKLKKHLSTVRRNEKIETWDDAEIIAGTHWEKEILDKLYQADIIILLITSNFIDSDFCYEKELKIALERHEKKAAKVVPIVLEHCDLEDILFDELKTLPSRKSRVIDYKDENEAFVEIARELKNIL